MSNAFEIMASTVALWAGFIAGLVWLVRYLTKVAGWWREEHRVHVVAFSSCLWLFYGVILGRRAGLISPGVYVHVSVWLFVVLTAIIVWRWVMFERGLARVARLRRDTKTNART